MQRMDLEFVPEPTWFERLADTDILWEHVETVRVLDAMWFEVGDSRRFMKAEFVLAKDWPLDWGFPTGDIEVLHVLKAEGRSRFVHACIRSPGEWLDLLKRLDVDLVWDIAFPRNPNTMVAAAVGMRKELKRVLDGLSEMGTVSGLSFRDVDVRRKGVLGSLSRRQREILLSAKREGYYDYPRRVRSEDLARKMGIRKSTLIEHLRRAENRLIQELLAEY